MESVAREQEETVTWQPQLQGDMEHLDSLSAQPGNLYDPSSRGGHSH